MVHFHFETTKRVNVSPDLADGSCIVDVTIDLSSVYPRVRDLYGQQMEKKLREKGINVTYSPPKLIFTGNKLIDLINALKEFKPDIAKDLEGTLKKQTEEVQPKTEDVTQKLKEVNKQIEETKPDLREINVILRRGLAGVKGVTHVIEKTPEDPEVKRLKNLAKAMYEADVKRREDEIKAKLKYGRL
jgi:gas vesicle protein